MSVLSHSVNRIELVNLGYHRNGKGPYMIRQDGYPPGSTTMDDNRYFLLSDGSWMINFAFFLLPQEELESHFYGNIKEVFAALDNLAGKKLVVNSEIPDGATPASILAGIRDAGNRLLNLIHEAKAGHFQPE